MIQEMELLIIDEVSMLRADLLDCINFTIKKIRKNNKPFGGIQILFIGDLMQLPPVVKEQEWNLLKSYYQNIYFFNAVALKENQPVKVELQKIYRQSNQQFIDLLNRFRYNQQDNNDIELLNEHYQHDIVNQDMEGFIHLTTHNHNADQINERKLNDLKSKSYFFDAEVTGDFPDSMHPLPLKLELKEGAQIMFIKNDPSGQQKFFNGRIGVISGLSQQDIRVKFEDGEEIFVEKYAWDNKRFVLNKDTKEIDEKYIGQFEQYPIKLAWAVTIHKSQGLTFEKAILDLEGTFAPGQLYVALSRLTSLDGLILSSKLPLNAPGMDSDLVSFVTSFQKQQDVRAKLAIDQKSFIFQYVQQAFDLKPLTQEYEYYLRGFDKDENRSIKQQHLIWHNQVLADLKILMDVGYKFIRQVQSLMAAASNFDQLNDRVSKGKVYFDDQFEGFNKRLADHLTDVKKVSKTKTYQKEIRELMARFDYQIRQIIKVSLLINYTASDRIFTKKDLHEDPSFKKLLKSAKQAKKSSKIPTALISYEMFGKGISVVEIAKERDLTIGTIEGHLCQFVKQGKLDVGALMSMDKVDKILDKHQGRDISMTTLKAELKDEFSYNELRIAMAHASYVT